MLIASIVASPIVALTNNVQKVRAVVEKPAVEKTAAKKTSFFDHRCLGIKPPAP